MPTKGTIEVPIAKLVMEPALQVRVAGLEAEHVTALMEALDRLPPIEVVRQGSHYAVEDGLHRIAAHQNAGRTKIKARVLKPPDDGDLYAAAFQANALHGKALTLRDREAFAAHLLSRGPDTPNMKIAARAGLSPGTVQKIREELEHAQAIAPTDRTVTRGESTYVYPTQRKPGELPEEKLGESLVRIGTRVFSGGQRVRQRQIASFLRRVVLAMEDGADFLGDEAEAAEACRLVLGDDLAQSLGQRLMAAAGPLAGVGHLLAK